MNVQNKTKRRNV